MIKLEEKKGKWFNSLGEFVGETTMVANGQVLLKTKEGILKELLYGWIDENGNFYPICALPYTYCATNCAHRWCKVCRYNIFIKNEGYYISD